MTNVKQLVGDSATSAELWLLPVPLVLIAEGGLSDIQSVAVALCYLAFVGGRVAVKSFGAKAVAETAKKAAPALLAAALLVPMAGCSSLQEWFDEPAAAGASVTIVNEQGQATTIDTDSQIQGEQTLEVEGVGTVTIDPGEAAPVETRGDQAANTVGQVVGVVTGISGLGLVVSKVLGGLIGSRRRQPQVVAATD